MKAGKLLPINFSTAARHNPQFEPELEAKFFDCFAGKAKLAQLLRRGAYLYRQPTGEQRLSVAAGWLQQAAAAASNAAAASRRR